MDEESKEVITGIIMVFLILATIWGTLFIIGSGVEVNDINNSNESVNLSDDNSQSHTIIPISTGGTTTFAVI